MVSTSFDPSLMMESRALLVFADWLDGPVFEPLQELMYFSGFFIEGGTVAWPNGADLAPETLHDRAKASPAA